MLLCWCWGTSIAVLLDCSKSSRDSVAFLPSSSFPYVPGCHAESVTYFYLHLTESTTPIDIEL